MSKYDIIPKSVVVDDSEEETEYETDEEDDEVVSEDEVNIANNTVNITESGSKIKQPKRKAINGKIIPENIEEKRPKEGEKRISLTALSNANRIEPEDVQPSDMKQSSNTKHHKYSLKYNGIDDVNHKEDECKNKLSTSAIIVIVIFCLGVLAFIVFISVKIYNNIKTHTIGCERWVNAKDDTETQSKENKNLNGGNLFKGIPMYKQKGNNAKDECKNNVKRKRDSRGRFMKQ